MQYFARLRFERVAAEMLVLLLRVAEARQDAVHVAGLRGIFHGSLQILELVVEHSGAAAAGDGLVYDRAALHLLHILPEVADREFPGDRDFTLIGGFFTHYHSE